MNISERSAQFRSPEDIAKYIGIDPTEIKVAADGIMTRTVTLTPVGSPTGDQQPYRQDVGIPPLSRLELPA